MSSRSEKGIMALRPLQELAVRGLILDDEIDRARYALQSEGVILYLSDTIWGLGADARSDEAVRKIYKLKQRDADKPLISLVDGMRRLRQHVGRIHPRIDTLLHYHHRPLTIIYPSVRGLSPLVTGADGSAAIRRTLDPLCRALIQHADMPIISTSANMSGHPFPLRYDDIHPELIDAVDYILKIPEREEVSNPSPIARYDKDGLLRFLR